MTDYVGAFLAAPRDVIHYGRRGMKWGQKIFTSGDSSSGKTETSTSAKKTGGSETSAPKKPSGNIQDNVESSSTRYARLSQQAAAGKAYEMTEQDLKFYNARTDALAKINKMNETQPSWLRETATKVIQQSAQRQMQTVADAIADKYVGEPIKAALKGAGDAAAVAKAMKAEAPVSAPKTKSVETPKAKTSDDSETTSTKPSVSVGDRARAAAQKAADSLAESKRNKGEEQRKVTAKKIEEIDAAKAENPRLLNITESVKYYRDNPSATPEPPVGITPGAYRIWLDQIREARGN